MRETQRPSSSTVRIDKGKPVTTDDAPSDWVAAPVTVHLSAIDDFSGVRGTRYSVWLCRDNLLGGIPVSAEGTTTIAYASVDTAGAWETTKAAYVRIDYTAPVTSSDATTSYVDEAIVTLAPADSGSGVERTMWRFDGGTYERDRRRSFDSGHAHTGVVLR